MNRATCILVILALVESIRTDEAGKLRSIVPAAESSDVQKDTHGSNHRVRSLPEVRNELDDGNWSTIAEALDVFNVRHLAKHWVEGKYPVNRQCSVDITRYIEGLRRQEIWALKMDDASGRFTNGFFWGNNYFTGSASECDYIGKRDAHNRDAGISSSEISEIRELNAEPKKRGNTGLSGADLVSYDINDRPPYPLGFFMMRISINGTLSPTTRLIHLGACLPFSCTAADISVIAKLAASDVAAKNSFVEKVRDQHNHYDIFSDPVFWALFGSSAVVLVLLIAGTGYDIYITKRLERRQKLSFDLEKHVKLEQLANGNKKVRNGKATALEGKAFIPVPVAEPVANGTSNGCQVNNNNDHEGSMRPASPDFQKLSMLFFFFCLVATLGTDNLAFATYCC